jgi:hypothetical protein
MPKSSRIGPCLVLLASAFASPLAAQVKLSGYGEASYSYASKPVDGVIVGRLYDRFANQFTLNGLKLVVERPAATDKWDAGLRADLVLGQNATVLRSDGFDFNFGENGDMTQLFVTLNIPTANKNGIQLKVGKLATLLGLEVLETVVNPNWSEGLQFVYVENFTHTGLEIGHRLSSQLDIQLRVTNGWDRVQSAGGNAEVMMRVGIAPSASTSIGLIGYSGAMQDGSDALRTGFSALLNQKFGTKSLWIQADYGSEEANANLSDPTQDASWVAVGAWLAFDLGANAGLAIRADHLNDANGARSGGVFGTGGAEHTLTSFTGTLNLKAWPNALVRPELRFDNSNLDVFDGSQSQFTVGLSVAYIF